MSAPTQKRRRQQSIGHQRYGAMRLLLNDLYSRGFRLPDGTFKALREACERAGMTNHRKSLVALCELATRVVHQTINSIADLLYDVLLVHGFQINTDVLSRNVRRFISNRNQIVRMLRNIEMRGDADYEHAVIGWTRKGDMTKAAIEAIMVECKRVSRFNDIAYVIDVEAKTHFHVVCASATLDELKTRLLDRELGLRFTVVPPGFEEATNKAGVARDVPAYLAAKLTPALQRPPIARRIAQSLGSVDHDEVEFGRVVTHRPLSRAEARYA